MPEVLNESPSLEEVLWNFSHFKDEKCRLTLRENPHFYAELPTSREAYGDEFRIDPTEDFRHVNEFYVLADKPELVHIMTDRISQSFGNFWCPRDAVIFKGSGVLVSVFSPSDVFPDTCGRLRGESIVKASLRGTHCGFCRRLPVYTDAVPGASRNHRGLQPIITEECSWMSWKSSNGCLPMHSSVDIGLRICTGQVLSDSPVRCDVIINIIAFANIDVVPGPLATNV